MSQEKIDVKDEVVEKIKNLIANGRQYFGSSGASLTYELSPTYRKSDFPMQVVQRGIIGERQTTDMLKKWTSKHANTVLVDSVHLGKKGENGLLGEDGADTDHVVIIGDSIIIIDTKLWKKRAKYTVSNYKTVKRNGKSFKGGKVNIGAAVRLWRSFFPEAKNIRAFVCIQQEKVFVSYDTQWKKAPFRLIAAENLEDFLDNAYKKMGVDENNNPIPINEHMVAKVVVCAVKPLNLLKTLLSRTDI